jgi:cytochrome c
MLSRSGSGRLQVLIVVLGSALLLSPMGCGDVLGFTQEQVAKGAETFRLQCARCHGPDGQGIADIYKGLTAPPLIGPGSLPEQPRAYQRVRHYDFQNIRDVYEFASSVMPLDQPASLYPEDYWNVLAYILDGNGMQSDNTPLNAESAAKISIATVNKQEQSSGKAALSQLESRPSGMAAGLVGSPADARQQGPAAAIVGEHQ